MSGGTIKTKEQLINCYCGCQPEIIWHYIKGVPNKIHYFTRCNSCRIRTRDRKNIEGAVQDWNERIVVL
jgi:hypothetical protein